MKKIIILILSAWIGMMTMQNVYGYDGIPLVYINHLDLSKLEYMWDMPGYARTTQSMQLKPNTTYTLVLSETFLGQHWNFPETMEIEMEEDNGSLVYAERPMLDLLNMRAYMTFLTGEGRMHILKMPVNDQVNYEAIVYEGTYANFPGFIPYVKSSEPLEYRGVLPLNVDQQPNLETIKSYVIAKNPFGQVISSTLIYDEYSTSTKRPGTYQMVFETTYYAIKKRYYLDVRVFDLTPPELSIEGSLEIPVNQKWSIQEIKNQITIHDNVDTLSTSDLFIISDTYSTATTVGSYQMTLGIVDQAGNQATLIVPIELVDRKGPNVKGPSSIYLYTTDTPITNAQIQSKLLVSDDVDGPNVTVNIVINEYNQTTTPGRYKVHFSAKDTQLNETIFIIYIHVIEHRGPSFEQSELILLKTTADQMSEEEIIDWLKNQLNLSGYHVQNLEILYNEYASNSQTMGSYYVYFTYDIDGETYTSRIRIDVEKKPFPWVPFTASIGGLLVITSCVWLYLKRKKP